MIENLKSSSIYDFQSHQGQSFVFIIVNRLQGHLGIINTMSYNNNYYDNFFRIKDSNVGESL